MKRLIKAFIAAAAIVACASANAQEPMTNSDLCLVVADFAYPVADRREMGVPYQATIQEVRSIPAKYIARELMEDVVFRAYHQQLRYLSRSELAAFAYGNCMDKLNNIRYQSNYR